MKVKIIVSIPAIEIRTTHKWLWRHNLNQMASGKPGAVQIARR
jgi:hypothetical protein